MDLTSEEVTASTASRCWRTARCYRRWRGRGTKARMQMLKVC